MLVIYAVLVFYVSSQKGEFIIVSHTNVAMPYGFIMRRKHFAGNVSACISYL